MPKATTKKAKKEVVLSSGSESGSESEGSSRDKSTTEPKRKSAGTSSIAETNEKKSSHRVEDIDGQPTWMLTPTRNVTVSEFKGRVYVNIREYFEKGGKLLPGKKGISLPQAQWEALVASADEISAALKEKTANT